MNTNKETNKNDIESQLEATILEIITSYRNRTAYQKFLDVTKDLKPKSCKVFTGWVSGSYLSFDCVFEKNGEGEVLKEIIKKKKKKTEDLNFIYGLNPKVFHFNPIMVVDEKDTFYIGFKLQKEK